MKKVSLSVINDLVTDNRVHKVSTSLRNMGFEPVLIGRILPESQPVSRDYSTRRMKLFFRKGPFFYLEYNIRLFFCLLRLKIDVFVANDLDTLPANYLASRIKRKPLVYDSHEYFTEVPELISRPSVRNVWTALEKRLVPSVDAAYTVCESIAGVYRNLYDVDFKVVRNLPVRSPQVLPASLEKPSGDVRIVLYQGALNLGRGLEPTIEAMQYLENTEFWLAGDGDLSQKLKELVTQLKLETRVKFWGRLPLQQLNELTRKADLGISLEEDLGLNYRFALPNKLFDYIQAGVPVLVSDLPEMKRVVEKYQIGSCLQSGDRNKRIEAIREALFDDSKRAFWKQNMPQAASELVWENEEKVLADIYCKYLTC